MYKPKLFIINSFSGSGDQYQPIQNDNDLCLLYSQSGAEAGALVHGVSKLFV